MLKIYLKCLTLLINLLFYSKFKKRDDKTSQFQISIIKNAIYEKLLTLKCLNRAYV